MLHVSLRSLRLPFGYDQVVSVLTWQRMITSHDLLAMIIHYSILYSLAVVFPGTRFGQSARARGPNRVDWPPGVFRRRRRGGFGAQSFVDSGARSHWRNLLTEQ